MVIYTIWTLEVLERKIIRCSPLEALFIFKYARAKNGPVLFEAMKAFPAYPTLAPSALIAYAPLRTTVTDEVTPLPEVTPNSVAIELSSAPDEKRRAIILL